MKVKLIETKGSYRSMYRETLSTVGKTPTKPPSNEWIARLIRSQHSPIRGLSFVVEIKDVPYWVSVHLTRHHVGCTPYVQTQRTDRTGDDRNSLPQNNLINMTMEFNVESLINISKKRLCNCASKETTQLWQMILNEIGQDYPEVTKSCVKECVYSNGYCREMFSCKYNKSDNFKKELQEYIGGVE